MAFLNITNPTFQHHLFLFRAPGDRHNQRHDIFPGATTTVFVGMEDDCHAIIEQHRAFGLRERKEALSRSNAHLSTLLYAIENIDGESVVVDPDALRQLRADDGEHRDDLAAEDRELRALGAAAHDQQQRREETSLEQTLIVGEGRNEKSVQKVQVERTKK